MNEILFQKGCWYLENLRDSSAIEAGKLQQENQAEFPIELNINGDIETIDIVAKAVHAEYRKASTWKKLRCVKVEVLEDDPDSKIYVLHVGEKIEFDWTWEGAKAFRPKFLPDAQLPTQLDDLFSDLRQQQEDSRSWYGDVVEVDEVEGKLYISAVDSLNPPTSGVFYVRPFEFLEALNAIYWKQDYEEMREDILLGRLLATKGDVHPLNSLPTLHSLPELKALWSYGWGILWGPPGTGKTHTVGQQVAQAIQDSEERILVISTTNKATDEVALSIGEAARNEVRNCRILRIGKNSEYHRFEDAGLQDMLKGTETDLMRVINGLNEQLKTTQNRAERARIRQNLVRVREAMKDRAVTIFTSAHTQVVVSTAFRALTLIKDPAVQNMLNRGIAPFSTIVIDEASLLSRATTAVLSMLAARRVVLVGDPRQLAPISKMSRVLPPRFATWLGRSGLSHLETANSLPPAVYMLTKQHRMIPDIRKVVSEYQYNGKLEDAKSIKAKTEKQRKGLRDLFGNRTTIPPAMWYILDEEGEDLLPAIRAERGPGNKSWVRPITKQILDKLFDLPEIQERKFGLFISPFAAQARDIRMYLAEKGLQHWTASTVHSQQGAQAEVVIFDTVNASSIAWPPDEWKRLINVGISRAEYQLILLASRLEMEQPFLRPLKKMLEAGIVAKHKGVIRYQSVSIDYTDKNEALLESHPELLGSQIRSRKKLLPVLSSEQQRLSKLRMDGKPRLVRGVAGSGKTVVLAHWLMQVVDQMRYDDDQIWVVYGNNALRPLIQEMIQSAWETDNSDKSFPWERVSLLHIKDVLWQLRQEVRRKRRETYRGDNFDYNEQAQFILDYLSPREIEPTCVAMFIDEAQDMGSSTLKLLTRLVEQTDPTDPNSRAVSIFYDNAQNVYSRPTPKWSDIGLDMRGRSTVMQESFRSTKPITEFALNVFYNLQPPEKDPEYRELIRRNLVEETERLGRDYWIVHFTQVDGPAPIIKKFSVLEKEFLAIAEEIIRLVKEEKVTPGDITLIYNGKAVKHQIETTIRNRLAQHGIPIDIQTGSDLTLDNQTVLATTTHSFKGYDSEIVIIPAADMFVRWDGEEGKNKPLPNVLYTAMTRARSLLYVYSFDSSKPASKLINKVLKRSIDALLEAPVIDEESSNVDLFHTILDLIGREHERWLNTLKNRYSLETEPLTYNGEVIAEPLFWFEDDGGDKYACFGQEYVPSATRNALEDHDIRIVAPGDPIP